MHPRGRTGLSFEPWDDSLARAVRPAAPIPRDGERESTRGKGEISGPHGTWPRAGLHGTWGRISGPQRTEASPRLAPRDSASFRVLRTPGQSRAPSALRPSRHSAVSRVHPGSQPSPWPSGLHPLPLCLSESSLLALRAPRTLPRTELLGLCLTLGPLQGLCPSAGTPDSGLTGPPRPQRHSTPSRDSVPLAKPSRAEPSDPAPSLTQAQAQALGPPAPTHAPGPCPRPPRASPNGPIHPIFLYMHFLRRAAQSAEKNTKSLDPTRQRDILDRLIFDPSLYGQHALKKEQSATRKPRQRSMNAARL